ncbi:hypothetical protein [Actinomyces wuliandei]|uniref:hypothetical protein n=1 Tax=Actinomyces wuliandei TaxID=2057743 RepID=UPI001FAAC6A3|nr:hypothetical protein [Actinomyces wuliandei]
MRATGTLTAVVAGATSTARAARPLVAAAFTALQLRESYLRHRPDVEVEGENHPHGMMTIGSKDFAVRNGLDLWAYTPLLTGLYEYPDRPLPTAYEHPGTYARLEALTALNVVD